MSDALGAMFYFQGNSSQLMLAADQAIDKTDEVYAKAAAHEAIEFKVIEPPAMPRMLRFADEADAQAAAKAREADQYAEFWDRFQRGANEGAGAADNLGAATGRAGGSMRGMMLGASLLLGPLGMNATAMRVLHVAMITVASAGDSITGMFHRVAAGAAAMWAKLVAMSAPALLALGAVAAAALVIGGAFYMVNREAKRAEEQLKSTLESLKEWMELARLGREVRFGEEPGIPGMAAAAAQEKAAQEMVRQIAERLEEAQLKFFVPPEYIEGLKTELEIARKIQTAAAEKVATLRAAAEEQQKYNLWLAESELTQERGSKLSVEALTERAEKHKSFVESLKKAADLAQDDLTIRKALLDAQREQRHLEDGIIEKMREEKSLLEDIANKRADAELALRGGPEAGFTQRERAAERAYKGEMERIAKEKLSPEDQARAEADAAATLQAQLDKISEDRLADEIRRGNTHRDFMARNEADILTLKGRTYEAALEQIRISNDAEIEEIKRKVKDGLTAEEDGIEQIEAVKRKATTARAAEERKEANRIRVETRELTREIEAGLAAKKRSPEEEEIQRILDQLDDRLEKAREDLELREMAIEAATASLAGVVRDVEAKIEEAQKRAEAKPLRFVGLDDAWKQIAESASARNLERDQLTELKKIAAGVVEQSENFEKMREAGFFAIT